MKIKVFLSENKFDVIQLDDVTVHGLINALNLRVCYDKLYYEDAAKKWVYVDILDAHKLLEGEEVVVKVKRLDAFSYFFEKTEDAYDVSEWTLPILLLHHVIAFFVYYGICNHMGISFSIEVLLLILACPTLACLAEPRFRDNVYYWLFVMLGEEPPRPPDFSTQRAKLYALGFVDAVKRVEALEKTYGDMRKAIKLYMTK